MIVRRRMKAALVGGVLVAVSTLSAWSVRRDEPIVETGEMGEVLAQVGFEDRRDPEWDLTVTRNARVEMWIDFLRGRNRDRTRLWLERSGRYAPLIQAELRSRGMPQDLLYLAMIESGFSPYANSRAAAVGIWQFIRETARRYGLRVDSEVDERRDPVRATSAALDYLQELYRRFGSWYLAAAAYNTGENRVDRLLRERARGARGSDALYWRIAPHLPQETRDYVPLMLAAGHIAKSPAEYGFGGLVFHAPLEYDQVWVAGGTPLSRVAGALGIGTEQVEELNPQLIHSRAPSRSTWWLLRIPKGMAARFSANFSAAAPVAPSAAATTGRFHLVRRGENLTVIARRYGLTVGQLRDWNGLGRRSLIKAGQRLRVGS